MWVSIPPLAAVLASMLALANVNLAQSATSTTSTSESGYLIGWYIGPSSTERLTAASPWVTSGTYAGECTTTDVDQCVLPTACYDNVLTYNNGQTYDCGTGMSCVTFTAYETSPNGLPSASNIICGVWTAWTIYHELPSSTSTSSANSTTGAPSVTPGPSNITATTTSTSQTQNNTSEPPSSSSSGSQAWIAGAVIGPLAGCAIIGAAVFLFFRRKTNLDYTAPPQTLLPQDGLYHGLGAKPYSRGTSELPSAEYHGYTPVAELPSNQQAYELSSARD
ncbi:hypothetical protein P175DRAFT_0527097 [Aspergillus ochraceoroseus IBT 24754]|uniref:Mid2 domain-containing protein n=1 Tax=Aspergillus ochraceoroseus IBT 24754 TaxID=1392256 RepID=A0A2T5M578_9EURO|nr:uncharacterized protein P175DRAFT_0527097 [Aspergillus ochraceoroseus IBT 24754]PTU23656.1 hypothetical protein P175DRAFT_0527097 [Aspergillus ochraceoroseus IBT 24754]